MSEETENKGEENKQISVRATTTGFYNGARRREGDVFFVPAGTKGKWFAPIDKRLADEAAAADEEAALAKQTANQAAIEAAKEADEEAAAKKKAAAEEAAKAGKDAELAAQAKKSGLARFIPGANKDTEEGDVDQGQASASAKSPEEEAKAALAAATAAASGDAGAADDDLA